ncbi:MAG TPA: hypothetical protein VG435_00905 [Acidimicrobiales bacterium]|nr:hypothetical protein [Acidimicrobiales bacterium]
MTGSFEALVAEGDGVPLDGWDFSWFAGRATEQRPSWGYALLVADRLGASTAALDIQTGGGEVFAFALGRAGGAGGAGGVGAEGVGAADGTRGVSPGGGAGRAPGSVAATEPWWPNAGRAARVLALFGGAVAHVGNWDGLPFREGAFDLVVSRHPVVTDWPEVARVLAPGGAYLSQQVGAGSNRGLTDFLMGPQPVNQDRSADRLAAAATAAGLTVQRLAEESLDVAFFDIGARALSAQGVLDGSRLRC